MSPLLFAALIGSVAFTDITGIDIDTVGDVDEGGTIVLDDGVIVEALGYGQSIDPPESVRSESAAEGRAILYARMALADELVARGLSDDDAYSRAWVAPIAETVYMHHGVVIVLALKLG